MIRDGSLRHIRATEGHQGIPPMKWTPKRLKYVLNLYPPYLGAGIRVTHIGDDWREIHVAMNLRWYNRNMVGTHFGGSIYAMAEPHLMLMLLQLLGKEYVVWDKSAVIEFVAPGKGTVRSVVKITDQQLLAIKANTADGSRYLPEFNLQVVDKKEKIVAKIKKTLYVRKKPD
jgi:acyl-coenzyme A thioesterase PaaI-like protein